MVPGSNTGTLLRNKEAETRTTGFSKKKKKKKNVCGTLVLIFVSSFSKVPEARPLDCWGVSYSVLVDLDLYRRIECYFCCYLPSGR